MYSVLIIPTLIYKNTFFDVIGGIIFNDIQGTKNPSNNVWMYGLSLIH